MTDLLMVQQALITTTTATIEMTDLSPAAQAVLDAYVDDLMDVTPGKPAGSSVAAALRAAADQVVPEQAEPVGDEHDGARHDQWMRIRYKLLAIAAELEGTDG